MNNKGWVVDFIFWMVMLLVFAILFVILYMTLSKANDGFQSTASIPTESKDMLGNWTNRFRIMGDWFMATIFIGFGIALILTAFLVRDNPIYVGIAILLFIIIGSLGYRFANVFYQFSSSSGIQPYSSQFQIIPLEMNQLPIVIIFMFVVFIIVLFGKSRSDSFL